jgi:hydroxymethylpyrimidine/phosphomethylpyrimidine kinase
MRPVALTIAGSDPSGGAGIQADLKTFHQFGVYGQAAITLLTVQNSQTVSRIDIMDPELVLAQVEAVLSDMPPRAAKTGALGSANMVKAIAGLAARMPCPLVVDPVMISKHGAPLIAEDARAALLDSVLPHAFLVTPNLEEAAALSGMALQTFDDLAAAAEKLRRAGIRNLLIKGGHPLPGLEEGAAVDYLFCAGADPVALTGARVDTPHTHGTGCTISAAITACLARGLDLNAAVRAAKAFIAEAIRTAPGLGQGHGPVNHFAPALFQTEP